MNNNVKIIIGSHGSGKSDWVYNRFLDMSRKDDDKSKIDLDKKLFLVVPEQDTNDKQRLLMQKANERGYGAGIFNIDVVSFDRIAHNVFDILDIEPSKESVIDDDVKTMIITLLLSKLSKANKLKFCNKMVSRVGFAKKLTQVVSEFYSYSVTDEEIDKVMKDKNSDIYKDKLNDFKLIFNEFKQILLDMNFSIKEDKYDLLSKRIEDVGMFNNSIIAFDGFTGFTPIQLDIFKKISNVAKEVYVTIDHRNPMEVCDLKLDAKLDDSDIFYLSKKFVKDIADAIGVKDVKELINDECIKSEVIKYGDEKKDLKYLEANLYKNVKGTDTVDIKNIEYYVANSIKDEVANAIQLIYDLIRNKGYKYNDIKVVVPSIENYRDCIIKSFNKYNIPLFIDDSEGILNSPYIEALRAAIDVVNYNFSYDSVMRYINSGITKKERKVNVFDNFLLEHAIRGVERYKKGIGKIKIPTLIENDISEVMDEYIIPLIKLYDNMCKKNGNNISNYLNAIRNFIDDSKLNEKFEVLVNEVENVKQNDTTYNRISAILNYSNEVFNRTLKNIEDLEGYKDKNKGQYAISDVSIEEFKRILDVGLTSKSLKSIPYSLDQIVVGDLMRSRFDNPKVEIFLGLNQSAIPAKNVDASLIDDNMRKLFSSNVKELSQTTIETALNQRFYTYLVLTNPTEKLILSYTKVDGSGESDEKSPVLYMIEDLFKADNDTSKLKETVVDVNTFNFYMYDDLIAYAALNMQDVKRYVKKSNGKYIYNFDDKNARRVIKAKKIIKYLKKESRFASEFGDLLNQKDYIKDVKLNKKLNDRLLNNNDMTFKPSASTIESFNSCPYKFFMERSLRLKENEIYKVRSNDIGNLAHRVFQNLFKDKDILTESKAAINSRIKAELDKSFDEEKFAEFNKKDKNFEGANKLEYLKERISDLIYSSADVLIDIARVSKFKTLSTEHSINYDINKNEEELESLIVSGKIDRIDVCDIDGTTYVNVVDYKTNKSEKTLDVKDVENGTNIQLVLYIDYCLNSDKICSDKKPIFAGSFYFWVAEPIVRNDDYDNENVVADEIKKVLGYNGVSNNDPEVLQKIYEGVSVTNNNSGVTAASLSNGYKIDGKFMSEAELDGLILTMRNKVNKSVNMINDGVITASPIKSNICKICPYQNICRKELLQTEEGEADEI